MTTWISVNDRMPTYAEVKDDHVLVMLEDGTICSSGFNEYPRGTVFGEWKPNVDKELAWCGDEWKPLLGNVKYWMPLPEEPAEMKKKKLKPCPFCGGKARLETKWLLYHVYCTKCHVGYTEGEEEDAIEKWNRRIEYEVPH